MKFRSRDRCHVRTDLGGLYFNAIVAVAIFGVWWLTRDDAWLLIIATQVLQMARQLAPMLRFDGYHVLADLCGVPDLFAHIKPILSGLLPRNWRRSAASPFKPWVRAVVNAWVVIVVPLLALALGLMVITFPRLVATAWDSLGVQYGDLRSAWAAGDVATTALELLSMLAITLPVAGMAYIIVRALKQVAAGVKRGTEGRPGRRALAVVLALALSIGLGYLWWPQPNRYAPIRPYERGTLVDAVPLALMPPGLREGRAARATVVWPAARPLPTADGPVLAVVLVPRTDGSTPVTSVSPTGSATPGAPAHTTGQLAAPGTWVFPFDQPSPPAEGDNQAAAVNTTNGATVYDVAFALVWAEGNLTDNVNEAFAAASCRDCTTVAVAFQVVIVIGQSATVVPQNLATAVNYNCVSCVTAALATQLVVTTNGPLSQAALTELNALWADIATYGTTLEGQPLTQIRARLGQFENQILAILQQNQGSSAPPQQATHTPSADQSGGPAATTGPSESLTPTITGGGTETSEPTGADQATESATNEPQPEDSETRPAEPDETPSANAEPTTADESEPPAGDNQPTAEATRR